MNPNLADQKFVPSFLSKNHIKLTSSSRFPSQVVSKTVKMAKGRLPFNELKNLYDAINNLKQTNSITWLPSFFYQRSTKKSFNLLVYPVGKLEFPTDQEDFKTAIQCVVQATITLHTLGYCHCDIRWPNIVKVDLQWMLIDLENAQIKTPTFCRSDFVQILDIMSYFLHFVVSDPQLLHLYQFISLSTCDSNFSSVLDFFNK